MAIRRIWVFFIVLGVIAGLAYVLTVYTAKSPNPKPVPYQSSNLEAVTGSYYTVSDRAGKVILETGFPIKIGDEYIDADNARYRVTSVKGWKAAADKIKVQKLDRAFVSQLFTTKSALAQAPLRVAVYHSHTDESFIPTQGVSSQPFHGAVYRVGDALATSLSNSGITTDHNYTPHDPHDTYAYSRSRRTVFSMLKTGVSALFDVHRDSAPSDAYFTYITGVESGRVMIVVGRQNPNMMQNLSFAQDVKNTADRIYPGLIRGIFIGHGDYNQDLAPSSLLFEIGTDQLPESMAIQAATLLGDVLGQVMK
ncbi:MAG: stage II sporulation protein P [Ignavibacteriales bacterium]